MTQTKILNEGYFKPIVEFTSFGNVIQRCGFFIRLENGNEFQVVSHESIFHWNPLRKTVHSYEPCVYLEKDTVETECKLHRTVSCIEVPYSEDRFTFLCNNLEKAVELYVKFHNNPVTAFYSNPN